MTFEVPTHGIVGADRSHRRRNLLTGRWVLVSPRRTQRPWLGQTEAAPRAPSVAHDPDCHLCPGAVRATGERNPDYRGPRVFANDFSALDPAQDGEDPAPDTLFERQSASGEARVICYSPDHSAHFPQMSLEAVRGVIDVWCEQIDDLGSRHAWVQVFENRGAAMGASNPHPHGQVWATDRLPDEPALEDLAQAAYTRRTGRRMLLDVAEREVERGERVVIQTDLWLVVVPFWAAWPFETLILPRFPVATLPALSDVQRDDLADVLKSLVAAYDRLFDTPFPYSFGWHGAPPGSPGEGWQVHAHVYPPLLRSATVRKFMVGYELMAETQRDLTAEQAAERLRAVARRA